MVLLVRSANPVEWQETRYQQRNIPAFIRRWWLAGPISLVVMIGGILLTLREVNNPTRDLAIHGIWLVHVVVVARALVAGANAISREHATKTWETLILTGISARQILVGKWLGVLHRVAPWMFALGAMRLVMLPVLMLAFVNRYAWWTIRHRSSFNSGYGLEDPRTVEWVAWAAVVAVVTTVVLTVLEALCCAAIGLAASAVTRRNWLALVAAFAIRFAPVILFAAITRHQVGNVPSWRVLRFTPLALADSGSAALYQLVLPSTHWTATAHINALPGVALATGLLVVLLAVSLFAAWAAIRAAGALPQPKTAQPLISTPTHQS